MASHFPVLVARTQDEQDRRSVRVRLEPADRSLIETASAKFTADLRRMLAALTEHQRTQWTALTTRLLTADADERDREIRATRPAASFIARKVE